MITTLIYNLVAMFGAFVTFGKTLIGELINLIGRVFNHVYTWLEPIIPDEVKEIFTALATFWADLDPFIDFMTYFVPVWGILGIVMSAYLAAALIRTTRWVLSIIPRVFTGL